MVSSVKLSLQLTSLPVCTHILSVIDTAGNLHTVSHHHNCAGWKGTLADLGFVWADGARWGCPSPGQNGAMRLQLKVKTPPSWDSEMSTTVGAGLG